MRARSAVLFEMLNGLICLTLVASVVLNAVHFDPRYARLALIVGGLSSCFLLALFGSRVYRMARTVSGETLVVGKRVALEHAVCSSCCVVVIGMNLMSAGHYFDVPALILCAAGTLATCWFTGKLACQPTA